MTTYCSVSDALSFAKKFMFLEKGKFSMNRKEMLRLNNSQDLLLQRRTNKGHDLCQLSDNEKLVCDIEFHGINLKISTSQALEKRSTPSPSSSMRQRLSFTQGKGPDKRDLSESNGRNALMRQLYQLTAICMARRMQILAPSHYKVGSQLSNTIHHLHHSCLVSWNHLNEQSMLKIIQMN